MKFLGEGGSYGWATRAPCSAAGKTEITAWQGGKAEARCIVRSNGFCSHTQTSLKEDIMNLAAYARIENAAYRAGHKIIQDKPKPAIPADSDERRILASMRPSRWYTVNDIINRTGLARGIVTHRLNSLSRLGKVGGASLPCGAVAYTLHGPAPISRTICGRR